MSKLESLKMKCCTVEVSAKFLMFCLSVMFWCAAAGLMYLGIAMFIALGDVHGLETNYFMTIPATVSIGLSVLFLVVGLIGLIAVTRKEAKWLRRMFVGLLFAIVVLEITGATLAIVYKEEISYGIEQGMNKTMGEYDHKDNYQLSMNYIQSHFQCCGIYKAEDWFNTPWGKETQNLNAVPQSCCRINATNCTGHLPKDEYNINHNGCHEMLYDELRQYLVYIIIVAVLLVLLEALALICTCYIVCSPKRDRKNYQQLQTNQHDSSYNYRA